MSQLSFQPQMGQESGQKWPWTFWGRWVVANALAEMIGLGASLLLWGIFIFGLEGRIGPILAALIVVLGSTLIEGSAVGLAQWSVLRERLPTLTWQRWLVATAIGACVAWTLGMVPSTAISMQTVATAEPPPELSDLLMYSLAAGMGFVLGAILAAPQWWVLRRHLPRAGWWVPANMVAWAVGMPAIFLGMSLAPAADVTVGFVLTLLGILAVAGALVGAVHGVVLVWLLAVRTA
jgi:hypothetical protein